VSPSLSKKFSPLLNAYATADKNKQNAILEALDNVFSSLPEHADFEQRILLLEALDKVGGQ
jgi:hypothetical protein